jgi:adenylate kinase
MARTIVLLGPPGSGKGTQAERLRAQGWLTLSTGDLLREARAQGTELGRKAAEYMDRGDLVPDDLILAALRDELDGRDEESIVLDGFPRTVAQADALGDALQEHGRELDAVVQIDVPDDVVAERISGRGRADDDPETVRERLKVYHDETEPLIAYYEDRGRLKPVDGDGDADAIAQEIGGAIANP